jgi:hypothetical protein
MAIHIRRRENSYSHWALGGAAAAWPLAAVTPQRTRLVQKMQLRLHLTQSNGGFSDLECHGPPWAMAVHYENFSLQWVLSPASRLAAGSGASSPNSPGFGV